jgi:ParB family chromosome partitioning protein
MSRKNLLNLIPVAADMPPAADNKLVGQVANSMREEKARQARADEIERRLGEGQAVIDLNTGLIDPSFVPDRMPGDIDGLLASIREQGQQVPILVRPHPEATGRYQVAFGHRRLRALKELQRPAKAIVRELTDEQLVVAQGQENNEREDLSYIEKARFADRLKDRFSRDVITASMSISKPELSVMLSVVASIPSKLIDAIGPAQGVGRRSWQDLASLLDRTAGSEQALKFTEGVQALPSHDRFKELLDHLKPPRVERGAPGVLSAPDGGRLAQVRESKAKMEITIDKKATPDFAAFVREQLPALYAEYRAQYQREKEA